MTTKTISGTIQGIFFNDSKFPNKFGNITPVIQLESGERIALGNRKDKTLRVQHNGDWKELNKGDNITITADVKESNGKEYLNSKVSNVKFDGAAVSKPNGSTYSKTSNGSNGGGFTFNDNRNESIVFQNSMAHATAISIHNASLKKKEVSVEDVIELAYKIAKVSIAPKLTKVDEVKKSKVTEINEDGEDEDGVEIDEVFV